MNSVEMITEDIKKLSGKYHLHTVFMDWIHMYAIAIQNACSPRNNLWIKRENECKSIMGRYNTEELKLMIEMNGLLAIAFEEKISDYLGEIYMKSGAGNKSTGQFFTPFHIAEMVAKINLEDVNVKNGEPILLNEPSSGGGGMILASAKFLYEKGINYQKYMEVVAQDLDWLGVYMTYVQLSLLGISATVIQGDTLGRDEKEPERILYTPKKMGVLV